MGHPGHSSCFVCSLRFLYWCEIFATLTRIMKSTITFFLLFLAFFSKIVKTSETGSREASNTLHQQISIPHNDTDPEHEIFKNIKDQVENARDSGIRDCLAESQRFLSRGMNKLDNIFRGFWMDILEKPEKNNPNLWIMAAEKLNIVEIFQKSDPKNQLKILTHINNWMIERERNYPFNLYPNRKVALAKMIKWMNEMKLEVWRKLDYHYEERIRFIDDSNFSTFRYYNIIINILTSMTSNNQISQTENEIKPLKINFFLFCRNNLKRWNELHTGSIESSIEYLQNGAFPGILEEIPITNFHYNLKKYFEIFIQMILNRSHESSLKTWNQEKFEIFNIFEN